MKALPTRTAQLLALVVMPFFAACTTKMNQATDPYHLGNFDAAAQEADKVAETETHDGKVSDVRVQHSKDKLWAGLEKAKILQEHGDFETSLALYTWLDAEAQHKRFMESWYANNPVNTDNWNAGRFLEQAGQTVVGADQTEYLLQPYEIILANSYMTLDAIMCGQKAGAYAQSTLQLQEWEKKDLKLAGEEVVQPDTDKLDAKLRGGKGIPGTFSMGEVYKQPGFGAAKESMRAAVADARASRTADPRVASAFLTEWAAYMKEGSSSKAEAIRKELVSACGAKALLERMAACQSNQAQDFVLVFVGAGKAPARDFFSIRLPVVIPTVGTGWYRGVYPFLRFRTEERPRQITVTADGTRTPLEQLDSIDAIAARNFQRRELELWMIPTIRGVIRTAASIAGQAAVRNDKNGGGLAALILLGSVALAEAEQADLRIWSTLPAGHYAAIIPRPKDGKLKLDFSDGNTTGHLEATVGPGRSIVYARAITPSRLSQAYAATLGEDQKTTENPAAPEAGVTTAPATDGTSTESPASKQ